MHELAVGDGALEADDHLEVRVLGRALLYQHMHALVLQRQPKQTKKHAPKNAKYAKLRIIQSPPTHRKTHAHTITETRSNTREFRADR